MRPKCTLLFNAVANDSSASIDLGGISIALSFSLSTQALIHSRARTSTALKFLVNPSVSVFIPKASAVATLELIPKSLLINNDATIEDVEEYSELTIAKSAVTPSLTEWWSIIMCGIQSFGIILFAPGR